MLKCRTILVLLICSLLACLSYSRLPTTLDYQKEKTLQTTPDVTKWDVERDLVNNIEILSLFPSSNTIDIKGAVLLFHGCNRNGMDWFEYPEEQIIVNHLLSLSLAAIAISSPDRTGSRCWNGKSDLKKVSTALNQYFETKLPIMQSNKQQDQHENTETWQTKSHLPLYAIGASSGGYFIPLLHNEIPLDGMICQISASPLFRTMEYFPPTVLIHMVHDSHANEKTISSIIKEVHNKPENQNKITSYACHPKAITSESLKGRVPTLSITDAEEVKDLLPLDEHGFLVSNPRSIWSSIVKKKPTTRLDKTTQLSLQEELNVAFAQHEITSDFVEEAMDFISLKNSAEL